MKIHTVIESGFEGYIVDVECHITNGLPSMIIVGFANKAVDEAKERIRSAFASSDISFPKKRITINLAPSDIPKSNASIDLSMAASIMATSGMVPEPKNKLLALGELGLDGQIRPIRGLIGKLLSAQKKGFKEVFVPELNANQASLVPGIKSIPIGNLKQFYLHLSNKTPVSPLVAQKPTITSSQNIADFSEIKSQTVAKRTLEISAAGGHNVLMSGPPGTGKSMLAKALPSILPPMDHKEVLETTHLHSLSSRDFQTLVTTRPFRAPHHSASDASITGGGQQPRPGEISLAHNGVLFLDEFPEFKRTAIEALRQPLEDRRITVSRANEVVEFPASFMLIATANPCPCGYFGSHRECVCSPASISRYRNKLSGPILDRIELFCEVENIAHGELLASTKRPIESSKKIQQRVINAREIQKNRYKKPLTNASIANKPFIASCNLSAEAKALFDRAAAQLELSPRSYMRSLRVARTIADLNNSKSILPQHIAEAVSYRPKNLHEN